MQRPHWTVALVVVTLLCFTQIGWTQEAVRLTIQSVTSETSATGEVVLVITGIGFGVSPEVMVDGQPAPVLAGATDTRLTVMAPPALLTTPGTYRLTVVDPARQVGDAFIVAALPATTVIAGTPVGEAARATVASTGSGTIVGALSPIVGEPTPNAGPAPGTGLIEDSGSPWRTAIGYQALFSNTSGTNNTASGFQALFANTTGFHNTATGLYALRANISGWANTATGVSAMQDNQTGGNNVATGYFALHANIGGNANSAFGVGALELNTAGGDNVAAGYHALWNNTDGDANTASGLNALWGNTTGTYNTAVGRHAGYSATTGHYNLFLGANVSGTASDTNVIRIGSAYNGSATPPTGQNRTFIAGIYNTAVSVGRPVVIDANGQLGTADSSSSFGIGTDTAAALFHLSSAGSQSTVIRMDSAYSYSLNRNWAIRQNNYNWGDLGFRASSAQNGDPVAAGNTAMTITAAGELGIGVVDPSAALHVATATGGNQKLLQIGEPGNVGTLGNGLVLRGNSADGVFKWYGLNGSVEATSPLLAMNSATGNVGIGTATPGAKLQVVSAAGTAGALLTNGGQETWLPYTNGNNYIRGNTTLADFGGRVSIGTSQQSAELTVKYPVGTAGVLLTNGTLDTWLPYTNGRNYIRGTTIIADDGGYVGIGTSNPLYRLHVAGDIYATGSLLGSDLRLKEQVQDLGYGLPEVLRLRPVSYRWKDPTLGASTVGLIAQEVQPLLPELVVRGKDEAGMLSLNYTGLVPVLIKAVQEQQATITTLQRASANQQATNAALQRANADLQARLARLEALVAALTSSSVK